MTTNVRARVCVCVLIERARCGRWRLALFARARVRAD